MRPISGFVVLLTVCLCACAAGDETIAHPRSDAGAHDSSVTPHPDTGAGGSYAAGGSAPKLDAPIGSGGAAGASGAGTGGAPIADVVFEPPPPCTTCKMAAAYMVRQAADSTNEPSFIVYVKNTGTDPIVIGTVTIRYFFTVDSDAGAISAQEWVCDYASITDKSNVHASFGSAAPSTADADTYLEISFTSTATIAPGASSGDIQMRFHRPGYQGATYTQSNDYSFNAALTTNGGTESTKLTGYLSGVLAWGIEPDGAGPEPSGNDP